MPLAINATSPVVALRCSLLRQLLIEKLVTAPSVMDLSLYN